MSEYTVPKVQLAPLAGVTDSAYRTICAEYGCKYAVTEMVSAKAITMGDAKSFAIADTSRDVIPVSVQLFGKDPDTMRAAAYAVAERFKVAAIDINMGCPVPKIFGNGEGSALMADPHNAGKIVRAVQCEVTVPVTVKIRSGTNQKSINAPEVAVACEQNGASSVAVHGRTRAQGYSGKADRTVIAAVKRAVAIPVIGNGDIIDAGSAVSMFEETGCDGIMVGRGAYGSPWIFREINAALTGRAYDLPAADERRRCMLRHLELLCALKGERTAVLECRRHISRYISGVRGASELRALICHCSTAEEMRKIIVGTPL